MGRNLSPAVHRELHNLEKDDESRIMAMKALQSYVRDLDKKAVPQFLTRVSETKAPSSSSVEHTVSLYEVLARTHGPNIFPQINNIMSTIIETLTSSAGSLQLQQACSKVISAIAKYGIDPSVSLEKRRNVIQSLCKPLSDSLLGYQENLSVGAALCLKALVDSDNWRFATDDLVNEVCLRVTGALEEKLTQTNSHLALAMALAKHNSFTVEAYARSLVRSGLKILNVGAVEGSSQKRLSAIQMVGFLMKSLDRRSIFSELDIVIEELEKCQSDQMPFVKGAAFEALQTAKLLVTEKRSEFEGDTNSVTGSNFGRSDSKNKSGTPRDRSFVSALPESQTADSFFKYGFIAESPASMDQLSRNFSYGGRSLNRKLWSSENGGVDVSLEDGFYSRPRLGADGTSTFADQLHHNEVCDNGDEHNMKFSGFLRDEVEQISTPSFQRGPSGTNMDNLQIFTTPRRLIHSFQDMDEGNSYYSENRSRRARSPCSSKSDWSPTSPLDTCGQSHMSEGYGDISSDGDDQFLASECYDDICFSHFEEQTKDSSDSVSSSALAAIAQPKLSRYRNSNIKSGSESSSKADVVSRKTILMCLFAVLFILLAVSVVNNVEEGGIPLPT